MAFGIIAGGGRGRRFESDIPKLELTLSGKPILLHSLEAFESSDCIDRIILSVPPDRVNEWPPERLRELGIGKASITIAGGETRQESVYLALESIPGSGGIVVVHDGARPMVTSRMIDEVCSIPDGVDGVITAVPLTDTVKVVDSGMVETTLPRKRLHAVQTPQAFRLQALRKAHERARDEAFQGTDDASLVERAGGSIRVIEGSRDNIKITFPEDIDRAEGILRDRRTG